MKHVVVDGRSPAAEAYLGPAFARVTRFAEMLATDGAERGLIGPRELPRLWDRHLLNSAAVVDFLPATGTLVDVGSGAGLPGVVLACIRPDLHTVLLEPMERRVTWLRQVAAELDLSCVEVVRARAEDVRDDLVADAVVARAVAPLDRLVEWTLPLLRIGGVLLAMKGDRAGAEISTAERVISRMGGAAAEVLTGRTIAGVAATTVVRVVKDHPGAMPPVRIRGSVRRRSRKR